MQWYSFGWAKIFSCMYNIMYIHVTIIDDEKASGLQSCHGPGMDETDTVDDCQSCIHITQYHTIVDTMEIHSYRSVFSDNFGL